MGRPRTCECGACRKCKHREYMRAYYQGLSREERRAFVDRRDKDRERQRDRQRSGTPARRRNATAVTKRWRKEHPERARAHSAVARALRSGKLVREPCETCGAVKVHAHHDDYSKPLEVRWICPLHHAAER